jgi:hypothetical protein
MSQNDQKNGDSSQTVQGEETFTMMGLIGLLVGP